MITDQQIPTAIYIERQTIQSILRAAMNCSSNGCIGLIGRFNDVAINRASALPVHGTGNPFENLGSNSDLAHTLRRWTEGSIIPCGIYYTDDQSDECDTSLIGQIYQSIREIPGFNRDELILMPLKRNIAGCLEAFAYSFAGELLQPLQLQLLEQQ